MGLRHPTKFPFLQDYSNNRDTGRLQLLAGAQSRLGKLKQEVISSKWPFPMSESPGSSRARHRTRPFARLQHGKRTIIIITTISFFLLERIRNPFKVWVSPAALRWKREASQSWTFAITSDLKSNSLQHFIAASAGKSLGPGTDTKL